MLKKTRPNFTYEKNRPISTAMKVGSLSNLIENRSNSIPVNIEWIRFWKKIYQTFGEKSNKME